MMLSKAPCNCSVSQSWGKPLVITQGVLIQCAFHIFLGFHLKQLIWLTVLQFYMSAITSLPVILFYVFLYVKVQCKVLHLLFCICILFSLKLPLPILLMQGNLAFGFHSCCKSDAKSFTQLATNFYFYFFCLAFDI